MEISARMRPALYLILCCGFLIISANRVCGQDARVQHITAKTTEGVTFTIWVASPTIKYGENVEVHYRVENKGNKVIYLVHEGKLKRSARNGNIALGWPRPESTSHGDFDYSFSKISKGERYQGKLVLPGDEYNEGRSWRLEVSLGYITDIADLEGKSIKDTHPIALLGILDERLKVVWLGGLSIDTRK